MRKKMESKFSGEVTKTSPVPRSQVSQTSTIHGGQVTQTGPVPHQQERKEMLIEKQVTQTAPLINAESVSVSDSPLINALNAVVMQKVRVERNNEITTLLKYFETCEEALKILIKELKNMQD